MIRGYIWVCPVEPQINKNEIYQKYLMKIASNIWTE